MSKNAISESLLNDLEDRIITYKSSRLYTISALYLLVGVVSVILLATDAVEPASSAQYLLMFAAIVGITGAFFQFFFGDKSYKYASTQSPIKHDVYYLSGTTANQVYELLQSRNFQKIAAFERVLDSGVRMDTVASEDGSLSCVQVLHFSNNNFEPFEQVVYLTAEQMRQLTELLK